MDKIIPPAEKVCTTYLRDHASVVALDARVANATPSTDKMTKPWVRVTQLDASADHRSDHLVEFFIQFDCYASQAGGQAEADLLTRTVREALRTMPGEDHDEAVVTGVQFLSCPRIPDTDFEPPRQRYSLSAALYMHP